MEIEGLPHVGLMTSCNLSFLMLLCYKTPPKIKHPEYQRQWDSTHVFTNNSTALHFMTEGKLVTVSLPASLSILPYTFARSNSMTSSLWLVWGNKSTGTAYLGIKGIVFLALGDLIFFEPSFTKFSIANPSGLQVT